MTLITKLINTIHGDDFKQIKKAKNSFHRQQLLVMKRYSQPLVSGWK